MNKIKQLQNGVCEFIDRQVAFYQAMQIDFAKEDNIIQYFKGMIDGLNQARSEIIREGAFLQDE